MTLRSLQGTIQTELFQEIKYHEQLGIITFSYGYVYEEDKGQGPVWIVQLPMCFKDKKDCLHIFRKFIRYRNEGRDCLCMYGYDFSWPWDAYQKIIEHKASKLNEL